jgi:hypothetical protein
MRRPARRQHITAGQARDAEPGSRSDLRRPWLRGHRPAGPEGHRNGCPFGEAAAAPQAAGPGPKAGLL